MSPRAAQPKQPKPFAYGTTVTVDQSRAELETLLGRHGATEFMIHRDTDQTTIVYRMHERYVRQVVRYPKPDDVKPPRSSIRTDVKRLQEAEWRRRWRAQVLITKGKLELVASGSSSFEVEFLADTMLANGQTVAEAFIPRIAESYASGEMPSLLLPGGR